MVVEKYMLSMYNHNGLHASLSMFILSTLYAKKVLRRQWAIVLVYEL